MQWAMLATTVSGLVMAVAWIAWVGYSLWLNWQDEALAGKHREAEIERWARIG